MTVAEYFPSPDSLFVLPEGMKIGFYILASMATLSLCATTSTLAAVAYQRIRGYSTHADQNLLPILQLLVADFIQALGLALSWHWIRTGSILAPTGACTAQGALLNFGDIANGLSVLNIAVDTLYRFRKRQQPGRRVFYSVAAAIFLIPFTMTIIGPIRHGNKFYVRAGNWCWVSHSYQLERLMLHYLWIFIASFGTVAIYLGLVINLLLHRFHVRHEIGKTTKSSKEILRAARYMTVYPVVYLTLWLPLALARMLAYAGHEVSQSYLLIAGILISSCGLVDSFVYVLTRRVLKPERRDTTSTLRSFDMPSPSIRRRSSYFKSFEQSMDSIDEEDDVESFESKKEGKKESLT